VQFQVLSSPLPAKIDGLVGKGGENSLFHVLQLLAKNETHPNVYLRYLATDCNIFRDPQILRTRAISSFVSTACHFYGENRFDFSMTTSPIYPTFLVGFSGGVDNRSLSELWDFPIYRVYTRRFPPSTDQTVRDSNAGFSRLESLF
jgi:hypothetical protein